MQMSTGMHDGAMRDCMATVHRRFTMPVVYLKGGQIYGVGEWDHDGCDADDEQNPVSSRCPEVVDAGDARCIRADYGFIRELSWLFGSAVARNKFDGGVTAVVKLMNGHPFGAYYYVMWVSIGGLEVVECTRG